MTQNNLKPVISEMVERFLGQSDESPLSESALSNLSGYVKSRTSDAIRSKVNKAKRYVQDRTGITAVKAIKKDYNKFKSDNNLS